MPVWGRASLPALKKHQATSVKECAPNSVPCLDVNQHFIEAADGETPAFLLALLQCTWVDTHALAVASMQAEAPMKSIETAQLVLFQRHDLLPCAFLCDDLDLHGIALSQHTTPLSPKLGT